MKKKLRFSQILDATELLTYFMPPFCKKSYKLTGVSGAPATKENDSFFMIFVNLRDIFVQKSFENALFCIIFKTGKAPPGSVFLHEPLQKGG